MGKAKRVKKHVRADNPTGLPSAKEANEREQQDQAQKTYQHLKAFDQVPITSHGVVSQK